MLRFEWAILGCFLFVIFRAYRRDLVAMEDSECLNRILRARGHSMKLKMVEK